jgi:hypothetical protein
MGKSEVQIDFNDVPGMVRQIADLTVERDRLLRDRDRLRFAAQAAITICVEYTDRPPLPDNCDADEEGGTTYCHDDARRAVAERVRDALDLTKQDQQPKTAGA